MPNTQPIDVTLRRLIDVDAALASADGLHLQTLADKYGVSLKTLRRDLRTLEELVGPIVYRATPHDNQVGRTHRHWYADRRRRLFAPWASR